jgi:hypothetical protein
MCVSSYLYDCRQRVDWPKKSRKSFSLKTMQNRITHAMDGRTPATNERRREMNDRLREMNDGE